MPSSITMEVYDPSREPSLWEEEISLTEPSPYGPAELVVRFERILRASTAYFDNFELVASIIVRETKGYFGAENVILCQLDAENHVISRGHTLDPATNQEVHSRAGLLGAPLSQRKLVVSLDPPTDPRASKRQRPGMHPKLQTFIGIPLLQTVDGVQGGLGLADLAPENLTNPEFYRERWPFVVLITSLMWHQNSGERALKLEGQLLQEQHRQVALLSEVGAAKDNFLATMSHEIRTPLNGIVGMAQLLSLSSALQPDDRERVRILTNCAADLLEMLNDILDYQKMIAGRMKLNAEPFTLQHVLQKTVENFSTEMSDKGIVSRISIQEGTPKEVRGDSKRLRQVLTNLVGNACKFAMGGRIDISVKGTKCHDQNSADRWMLEFCVKDNGKGIRKEDQKKIFDIFTQLEGGSHRGTGLGLAICEQLVKLHCGRIWVESEGEGYGSAFYFTILVDEVVDVQSIIERDGTELKGLRVILVDDKVAVRLHLGEYFQQWGTRLSLCSSASEVLLMMKHNEYDLAVVDICMPGMSGIELAECIRKSYPSMKLLAVSSAGAEFAGRELFDQVEEKPLDEVSLLQAVLKLLRKPKRSPSISPARQPKRAPDQRSLRLPSGSLVGGCLTTKPQSPENDCYRILVAEDELSNQIVIREMLKELGYFNVRIVGNGKECLDTLMNGIVRSRPFDLVLVDVKMPVMDGLQCAREIVTMFEEQYAKHRRPWLIAVTASVMDSDRRKCYNAGMDYHVRKPVQMKELQQVIQSIKNETISPRYANTSGTNLQTR